MPRRIEEDHKDFKDVYSGRLRKALKKFIKNGSIFRTRGDGKKIDITIPRIDIPHIVYGGNDKGVGRGPGKEGDVIGKKGKGKGKGKGNKAGKDPADGITIAVDMEDVFKFLKDDLKLPDLKPKQSQTFDEVKIKYNDIAKQGPESLRHNRRTMLQAMKRMAGAGQLDELHEIPGYAVPVKMINPINTDRRYRQYREIKLPSSNAAIFFARDGSGSMGEEKCGIVSDMAWWIDIWIRRFYEKVERVYVWHDTRAKEVDEDTFYNYRYGGGTMCSSSMKLISQQFENRFPPEKWNIYVLYFSDGENWGGDNEKFNNTIKELFPTNVVNFVGITQILSWQYGESLKQSVDDFQHAENVRTTEIGGKREEGSFGYGYNAMPEEERDIQIRKAIIELLGTPAAKAKVKSNE